MFTLFLHIVYYNFCVNPFTPYLLAGKKSNSHSEMIHGEEYTVRQVDEVSGISDGNENHATQKSQFQHNTKVVKGPKDITWLAEEAVLYLHNEDKCYEL